MLASVHRTLFPSNQAALDFATQAASIGLDCVQYVYVMEWERQCPELKVPCKAPHTPHLHLLHTRCCPSALSNPDSLASSSPRSPWHSRS